MRELSKLAFILISLYFSMAANANTLTSGTICNNNPPCARMDGATGKCLQDNDLSCHNCPNGVQNGKCI